MAFLSCGSALQPIFPKSQCWCMEEDGNKFILQIRPPSYWRIELASPNPPGNSLRECFESVLLLDKTPCPFKESVPISLPSESLSVRKRRPWKPLRSYPSEPILSTEPGDVCGDSQLFNKGCNGGAGTEHQSEGSNSTATQQEEEQIHRLRLCKVTKGSESTEITPHSVIEEETTARTVSLEDQPRAADKARSRTVCVQNSLSADARLFFSEKTSHHAVIDVKQANAHPARDSVAVTDANQTAIPSRPNKGQQQEKPPTDIDEIREIRRRHTIASSWRDAELEALVQTTSGGMLSEQPTRQEKRMGTRTTQPKEEKETKMPKVVIGRGTSPFESHHHHAYSQDAPQLRLRCKELSDGNNAPATEDVRSANAHSNTEPAPGNLLSKTLLLLFYAIFGILVFAFETAGNAVVQWFEPTRGTQRNSPGQPSTEVAGRVMSDYHHTMGLTNDDK